MITGLRFPDSSVYNSTHTGHWISFLSSSRNSIFKAVEEERQVDTKRGKLAQLLPARTRKCKVFGLGRAGGQIARQTGPCALRARLGSLLLALAVPTACTSRMELCRATDTQFFFLQRCSWASCLDLSLFPLCRISRAQARRPQIDSPLA